ncbi:MAG: hypothetical protein M1830_008417, partial [Pleopsidium flavum]
EQAVSNSWTDIEVNVGIICACMPALKQPLTKLFPRVFHPTQHTANYTAAQYSGTHHSHLQMPGNAHRGSFRADKALGPQDGGRDIILQRVDRAMAITKVTDVDVHFDESNSLQSKGPTHYSAIYNDRLFIGR